MKFFSPHQLQRETRPLSEKALDALEARDIDTLNLLLGRMSVGHQGALSGIYTVDPPDVWKDPT